MIHIFCDPHTLPMALKEPLNKSYFNRFVYLVYEYLGITYSSSLINFHIDHVTIHHQWAVKLTLLLVWAQCIFGESV